MTLVLLAMPQQQGMQLLDVVLGQGIRAVGIKQ
jgi:hypothetical protein